jgi:bifunctional DNA primase/polymerase-like protein
MSKTFKDRALPLMDKGLAVMPLKPQTKEAFIPDFPRVAELANRKQVLAWDKENPNYNVGVVAIMGRHCFLDDDCGGALVDMILKDTGIDLRKYGTYYVRTAKGYHFYFKGTVASIVLGNCKKAGVYDFQANDKYVVGAYSVHPSGYIYEPMNPDAPIKEIPEEIVKWLTEHKDARAGNGFAHLEERPLSEDFDPKEFIRHYELAGHWEENKYILDECPFAGRYHTNGHGKRDPKATCLLYDEKGFNFSCLATTCEGWGAGIGKTISKLNETHAPFEGDIWEKQPVEELLDVFGAEEVDVFENDVKAPSDDPKAPAADVSEGAAASEASGGEELDAALEFPEECLYGKAGKLARQMNTPLGLAYPALVTAFSVLPRADEMLGTRLNLYCGLIAAPEMGKNESIKRGLIFANLVKDVDFKRSPIGGDAQLTHLLGDKQGKKKSDPRDPGPKRLLLVNNELTDVLKKTGIDNSTLGSRLCDLWDENDYTKPVDRQTVTVDCRLSWIGGIPADEKKADRFTQLFGVETNHGLYPRFVFGYFGGEWAYVPFEMPEPLTNEGDAADAFATANGGLAVVSSIDPEARKLLDEWTPDIVGKGRLKYNCKKWAILTAAINGEHRVTAACARKAIRMFEWQVAIRRKFQPGEADDRNREAQFTDILLKALVAYGGDKKFVSWKRIANDRKWVRQIDPSIILRAIANLDKIGTIQHEKYDEENGKPLGSKIRLTKMKEKK